LDHKPHKHHKIRFGRGDFSALSSFPSAAGHGHLMRERRPTRRMLGLLATAATVLTSLALIVAAVVYIIVSTGIGSERISDEAEAAIRSFSGLDVEATLGRARMSVERFRLLAITVPDVSLTSNRDGKPLLQAGSIDFGLRVLPLLTGSLQVGSARVSDARIFPEAFASGGSSDWLATLRNQDGLIDPDLVAPALFGAVHQLFDAVGAGSTRSIELDNVELVSAPEAALGGLKIDSATLARAGQGGLRFSAEIELQGRGIVIDGSATRDPKSKLITALNLNVSADAGDAGDDTDTADAGAGSEAAATSATPVGDRLGSVELNLSGSEGATGTPSKLSLSATLGTSTFAIDKLNYLEGEVKLSASITSGENKMRIERLEIAQGRSDYVLYGPVGPRPVANGEAPAYRFELASDNSVSAPAGSTEPALPFSAMISGTYDPVANRLEVPSVDVRTASGGVAASLAADFVAGKPPGIDLAVTLSHLSVSDLKQLWPFTAVGNARLWAMNNLFGGNAANGRIHYRVPPGRIGNGVPLNANEVSGHIEVSGTRFDITGSVPPMRDAAASIDFRGNDVDVALSSGVVFLPDGGSVAASNGVFTIRDAYTPVVIGQLELDVAGDAQSVTRLASYDPIDGLSRTGMSPQDFSGQVSGHISAPIPLVGGADMNKLPWKVSLDFEDLALAKPVDDHLVSEADGNITIDPQKAVIKAKGRLNGAPADIAMVEPLKPDGPEASRDVSLVLDNQAREAMAPGSGVLIDGTVKLSFTEGSDNVRKVKADLTGATLNIPWVGWSKGPGVSANTTFNLSKSGDTTRLSDFKIAGKSFSVAGDIALSGGGLSSAKLGTVQLNRGDALSVSIQRNGKGFDIKVSGDTLDARSLIKLMKSESKGGEDSSKRPISIDAKLGRVVGFHDEVMSGVTLSYAGTGSVTTSATVSATTSSGATFSGQDETDNGMRGLTMQSKDAGAVLRFLDIYDHMSGGTMKVSLAGEAGGVMTGPVDASNFEIVNEPKLSSLVSTTPVGSDRSLNEAVRRDIDTSRVTFERAYAWIAKGDGGLKIDNGVLRGPLIGSTFQGTLYDRLGKMDMTGTFMPAYGINRIFGELPLVGAILGNGRDRGLIGVTFRLSGDADKPNLQINPLSVIAPGIFRSIFEFR
jgi:Protein of unknown function